MDIQGLDYNTQRERLKLPEYGREIQSMVDHAVALTDRAERQRCAETIVAIMGRMFPQPQNTPDYRHKLWDHLALMSDFKLDVDYPCDVSEARTITTKPDPLPYPMTRIPVRHYGHMVFEMLERLKTMPDGPEYNELVRLTANQMKRDLYQWGHGSTDDEKVISDIASLTDGRVQLDPDKFTFSKEDMRPQPSAAEKKKNRRK